MSRTQGDFVTHRCSEKPKWASLRRYHIKPDGWILGERYHDWDWDVVYLRTLVTGVRFCPWCGEELQ